MINKHLWDVEWHSLSSKKNGFCLTILQLDMTIFKAVDIFITVISITFISAGIRSFAFKILMISISLMSMNFIGGSSLWPYFITKSTILSRSDVEVSVTLSKADWMLALMSLNSNSAPSEIGVNKVLWFYWCKKTYLKPLLMKSKSRITQNVLPLCCVGCSLISFIHQKIKISESIKLSNVKEKLTSGLPTFQLPIFRFTFHFFIIISTFTNLFLVVFFLMYRNCEYL